MYEAVVYDPNSAVSGTFNTNLPINGSFVAFNESNVGQNFTFSNGDMRYIAAWTMDKFTLPTKTPIVTWSQKVILAGNTNPISQVVIEAYLPNETISGTFPAPIQHTSYIPNIVSTAMGGSTSLQNDGNISGTQVYESNVSGSPGSNVLMQNQGLIEVFQWIASSLTQIFKIDPGAASVVKLGNTGLTTESLGNMTVDQVLTAIGNTSLSTLLTSGKATLNSAEISNNLTVDGTATFNGAGASIDGSNNFNGNAINVNTVNAGTVNATGNITEANNTPIQFKDSGGTARSVLNVGSTNHTTLRGITGTELVDILSSAGVLKIQVDTSAGNILISGGKIGTVSAGDMLDASDGTNMYVKCIGASGKVIFQTPNGTSVGAIYKSSTNGSALQLVNASAAAVDTLYIDNANEVVIQLANNTKRFYVADTSGVKLFSVDSSGNVRAKGTITPSTTP